MSCGLWVGILNGGNLYECCSIILTQITHSDQDFNLRGWSSYHCFPSRLPVYLLNLCIKRVLIMIMSFERRRRMILTVISWNTYT